jgi:hypothetical protein
MRTLFLTLALAALAILAPGLAAWAGDSQQKPVLRIQPARSASNSNRMLFDRLRTAARNRLTRFKVVEGDQASADLVVSAEFLLEPTVEVDRKARTEEYERKDSKGKTIKDTRIVETIEYASNAECDVRITDSRSGTEDVMQVVKKGTSTSSSGDARDDAFEGIVREILAALRDKHKLEAAVRGKDGRTVFLDRGFDYGIEDDAIFAAVGPGGEEIGEVRIDRVERDRSVGRIRAGYYRIAPGTRLAEKLTGIPPRGLAFGLSNRLLFGPANPPIDLTFLGAELHLKQADPDSWADFSLELGGFGHRIGSNGVAALAHFIPQLEVIPEWLWLHGDVGGAIAAHFTGSASKVGGTATSMHLVVGAGATLTTPFGLRISADAGVMTPWTLSTWQSGFSSSGDAQPVTTGLEAVSIGGLYSKAGLTFGF